MKFTDIDIFNITISKGSNMSLLFEMSNLDHPVRVGKSAIWVFIIHIPLTEM